MSILYDMVDKCLEGTQSGEGVSAWVPRAKSNFFGVDREAGLAGWEVWRLDPSEVYKHLNQYIRSRRRLVVRGTAMFEWVALHCPYLVGNWGRRPFRPASKHLADEEFSRYIRTIVEHVVFFAEQAKKGPVYL